MSTDTKNETTRKALALIGFIGIIFTVGIGLSYGLSWSLLTWLGLSITFVGYSFDVKYMNQDIFKGKLTRNSRSSNVVLAGSVIIAIGAYFSYKQ